VCDLEIGIDMQEELDLKKYPVPNPDGPCTYCGVAEPLGFDPIISEGIGGGIAYCEHCNTSWYMNPVSNETHVFRGV
jgi:hypothetical protein